VKKGTLKQADGTVTVAVKMPKINDELKDTRDEMLYEAKLMAAVRQSFYQSINRA